MFRDKRVVVEVRITAVNAVNFRCLAPAQCFIRIEAPDSFEQTLPPQNFVQPRDAATKAIRRIEEGGITISDFDVPLQKL